VALWSALLVAVSPYNVWYSQEVRMYSLGAGLGLVALWCALGSLGFKSEADTTSTLKRPDVAYAAGYVLAAAAGLYVLYYFAFLLAALTLAIGAYLLVNRRLRALRTWLLAQVAVLVLYAPWLPIAWRQATAPPVPPWRSFIPLPGVLLEAWTALSLGQSVQPGQVWPVLVVTGVLFVLGLQLRTSKSANTCPTAGAGLQSPLLLLYTFFPLLLIYLASLVAPLYHVRYLFAYSPPVYILLGAGLARLAGRAWPLAAGAALLVLGGSAFSIHQMHTNPRYAPDDLRAAVDFIAERWRPGDALLINAGYAYTGFIYYYERPIAGRIRLGDYRPDAEDPAFQAGSGPLLLMSGAIGGDPQLGWGNPDSDFYATTQAETAAALARVTQTFPRLWMLRIYDTVTDPQGFIRDWLAANSTPFEDRLFGGESSMRVQGFMSTPQPSPPAMAEIDLEGGMALLGWTLAAEDAGRAGAPLDVVLWWRSEPAAAPRTPYAVSLKLWAKAGPSEGSGADLTRLAAQQDEWPVGSLFLTPDWPPGQAVRHPMRLWLPADLPPGAYQLTLEMYDPASVRPLARRDGQGHLIRLDSVTLIPDK
jgi:hypothetical protein